MFYVIFFNNKIDIGLDKEWIDKTLVRVALQTTLFSPKIEVLRVRRACLSLFLVQQLHVVSCYYSSLDTSDTSTGAGVEHICIITEIHLDNLFPFLGHFMTQ